MKHRYLGLISGTSADGIDAALVEFDDQGRLAAPAITRTSPYPADLRAALLDCMRSDAALPLDTLGELDQRVARAFADAARTLLVSANLPAEAVTAIGSHGQTLFHAPDNRHPHTLQIGDPSRIAALTGIDTIADFRRADMAAGGQGAPLAPALHAALWRRHEETRAVVNLGGISNVTLLPSDPGSAVIAFDAGPANCLMDGWHARHRGGPVDLNGEWASQGSIARDLLRTMLADPYFARSGPKSTGREYFDAAWLDHRLAEHPGLTPVDVQSTLLQLTVETVASTIEGTSTTSVYLCGGGAHNQALMSRLQARLPDARILRTDELGIPADDVEAVAFAWLAMRHVQRKPGNLPSVTGASRGVVLGGCYPATGADAVDA